MSTFEELGLDPSLVEALAAEGIEEPTALQADAIPLIARGSSVVVRAGPGSGLLVTYGVPLLGRVPSGAGHPSVIVLSSDPARCGRLAAALSRLAAATGHVIGALGAPWHSPETSDVLFATPADVTEAVRAASLKLGGLETIVVETASELIAGDSDRIAAIVSSTEEVPVQIVVAGDPLSPQVREWVDEHARRAVFLPADAARAQPAAAPTSRGSLAYHVLERTTDEVLPAVVASAFSSGASHVLLFSRTADDAADLGDLLQIRGFTVGRPGETDCAIWLGLDPLHARRTVSDEGSDPASVTVISATPPLEVDELDRRHGGGWGAGIVLVHPREVAHLESIAAEAGYELTATHSPPASIAQRRRSLAEGVEAVLSARDLVPYALLLEPLFERFGSVQVSAALAAMLADEATTATGREAPDGAAGSPARPPAWARLFLSVGRRDGIGARDLLGAILGEAGIDAAAVGKIELKDAFSRVEVHDDVAGKVIAALNGTSIRGRSVRADFDRSEDRARDAAAGKPPRRDRRPARS